MGRRVSFSRSQRAKPRSGETLRALAALLGILALTVGVPLALWQAVGWPLPHALPTLGELRDGLSRTAIPEEFFPKAVAVFAWLVWAQFVACIVVEAWSALRGRLSRQVPGAGWGTQRLASNLVAAALLLLPSQGLSVVAFASTPQRPPAVVRTVAPAAGGTPGLLADQATGTASTAAGGATGTGTNGTAASAGSGQAARDTAKAPVRYEVHRRDTLWDIAERHLGDPLRWPEIFELNKGRLQPDGRELKQAHWIFPGWVLLLPPDATGVPKPGTGGQSQPGSGTTTPQHQTPTPTTATTTTSPQPNAPAPTTTSPPNGTHTQTSHPTTTPSTAPSGNGTAPSGLPVPGSPGAATPTTTLPATTTTQPSGGGGGGVAPAPSDLTPTTAPPGTPRTTTSPEASKEPGGTAASQHWPVDNLSTNLQHAGLLAAGLLAVLGVLRVIQQRRRRFRRQIAMPDEGLAPIEAALRSGEAPDAAELVDLGLRTMAAVVQQEGMELPEVVGVLVSNEMMEILLATEAPAAPEPFVLSYSRRRWGLPVEVPLERLREAAGDAVSPVPALVTLGRTSNGLLLVNLESPGLTALGGDEDAARAVLTSFAVELATCRWADYIELVLVGFGGELQRLERARTVASVREMLPWLEHKADDVADLLGETGARSVLAGRIAGTTPDGWVPAVVLCAERPTAEEVTRLVALTAVPSRSPVAAVIAAGEVSGARWTLDLPEAAGELLHLPQFGVDVVPQRLDPDDYDGIARLLDTTTRDDVPIPDPMREPARRPFRRPRPAPVPIDDDYDDKLDEDGIETETDEGSDVTSTEPAEHDEVAVPTAAAASSEPAESEPAESADGAPATGEPEPEPGAEAEPRKTPHLHELRLSSRVIPDPEMDDESEVEVRVLGKVEIGGIDRVERGKSEELIVFLALHPDGVDGDQLSEALWPGRPPAKGTLNTTTAVARAYLGMTPDGEPRLPHARNGIYRLDPSVGLDWTRFHTLAERGYGQGEDGAADLRRALELVRGRPFQGAKPRSYGWAQLDEVPVMESSIVDAADHLAGLLLHAGDHGGCQWAARRGLVTAPYDERLYRKLMLAADAAGNPAGVEAVMDELLLRLDEENLEPYDTLHEETRALYERLTRHRAARKTNAG